MSLVRRWSLQVTDHLLVPSGLERVETRVRKGELGENRPTGLAGVKHPPPPSSS
jgi:hypothetical protein